MGDFEKLIDAVNRGSIEEVRAIIQADPGLIRQRDAGGATALHQAAFGGHSSIAQFLVQQGADVNATDGQYHATPAGWAIEYLREMGAFLAIELNDFAFAIRHGEVKWVARFLKRFPKLRQASDEHGTPFRILAEQSGNPELIRLFTSEPEA